MARCELADSGRMLDRFQNFTESVETYILEVIFNRRQGNRADMLRGILHGLSRIFESAIKLRRSLYDLRIMRDRTLGVQVIAIGNLTVGGTGKTPVVEKFARALKNQGRKVAILSRGYRSKPAPFWVRMKRKLLFQEDVTPPRIVSDGTSLLLDSESAGDEPFMLATNLRDVIVLVDKDRVKAGRFAIERFGCDTLLLDDGFQYWKLQGRRTDIVLIDSQQPWGNNFLLPRGILREPPKHLRRAHTVFLTKSDGENEILRNEIHRLNPIARIIECVHHPLYFEDCFTGERVDLDFIHGKKIAAFSGIAQPESFENSLIQLGGTLVYTKRYADHHRFSQQEILNVINRSKIRQADIILTTQKDAVRIARLDRRDLPIFFMRVEIKIIAGANNFDDCVRKICFLDSPKPLSSLPQ